jgi:hypothetical protein
MREAMGIMLRGDMYDLQNNHLAEKRREHDLEGYEPNFGYPKKFML